MKKMRWSKDSQHSNLCGAHNNLVYLGITKFKHVFEFIYTHLKYIYN